MALRFSEICLRVTLINISYIYSIDLHSFTFVRILLTLPRTLGVHSGPKSFFSKYHNKISPLKDGDVFQTVPFGNTEKTIVWNTKNGCLPYCSMIERFFYSIYKTVVCKPLFFSNLQHRVSFCIFLM